MMRKRTVSSDSETSARAKLRKSLNFAIGGTVNNATILSIEKVDSLIHYRLRCKCGHLYYNPVYMKISGHCPPKPEPKPEKPVKPKKVKKSITKYLVKGEYLSVPELEKKYKVPRGTIYPRIRKGLTGEFLIIRSAPKPKKSKYNHLIGTVVNNVLVLREHINAGSPQFVVQRECGCTKVQRKTKIADWICKCLRPRAKLKIKRVNIKAELLKKGLKLCNGCKNTKEVREFYFYVCSNCYESKCRECIKYYKREKFYRTNGRYPAKVAKRDEIEIRIKKAVRRRLKKVMARIIKNKGGVIPRTSTSKLLGCTGRYLKEYLESKFKPGMTWDNYGFYGWHVDHILPLSSFDLRELDQLERAAHYTNLQPLWAKDNLKKGSKVLKDTNSVK